MSRKAIDLTGQEIGRWKVLERAGSAPGSHQALWLCKCLDCGIRRAIPSGRLRYGGSDSCADCSRGPEEGTDGYRLWQWRRVHRWSQAFAGARIGVSGQRWHQYERMKWIHPRTMKRLTQE